MSQTCSACGGTLEMGFIPDAYHANGVASYFFQTGWYSGTPSETWFSGVKIQEDKIHPLYAYRCQQCGLLKIYALPPGSR